MAGCGTTPPPRPAAASSSFLSTHRITLGSAGFLPASAVVAQLKGQAQWDPESQVWSIAVGPHELRAAPQMSVVLVDGVAQPVAAAPVMRDGELLLPEGVWSQWLSRWAVPVPPRQVSRPSSRIRTIVVDAGHGGNDPGAIGRNGLREKSVTLDIALRLQKLLEQDDFRVVMTRASDRFVSLGRRSEIANQEGADLFVSIHANASRRRSISGYEVYFLSEATDDHARALEAAENTALPEQVGQTGSSQTEAIVWDLLYTEHRAESTELAAAICRGLKQSARTSQNRGVKSARFAVLKGSRMPAVLVEVGFISHPTEEQRLRQAEYREAIAEGVRRGILAFHAENGQRL